MLFGMNAQQGGRETYRWISTKFGIVQSIRVGTGRLQLCTLHRAGPSVALNRPKTVVLGPKPTRGMDVRQRFSVLRCHV
jgi:hypothetical protein